MFPRLVPSILITAALLWCHPLPVQAATNRSLVSPLCHAMGNLVALTTTWRDSGLSRAMALTQLRAAAPDASQHTLAKVLVDIPYSNPRGLRSTDSPHISCVLS